MSTIWCDFAALKPSTAPFPTFSARSVARRRLSRRRQMRLADLGRQPVLGQRGLDPRDQIAAIGLVVGVLELAAAAFGEMTARRLLVMRAGRERAVVEQGIARHAEGDVAAARRHPVAARRDADDQFVHNARLRCGIAAARSSAIIPGPAISAARPCSHTAAQAASNAAMPRARIAAIIPASTSPVPALASQAGAGGAKPSRPSGDATNVSGPLYTTTAPRPARRPPAPARPSLPVDFAEQLAELALVRA